MRFFQVISLGVFLLQLETVFAFESYEHMWIGDSVDLHFPDGTEQTWHEYPYADLVKPLVASEEFYLRAPTPSYLTIGAGATAYKISFGEIVALSGDFFNLLDGTISSREAKVLREDPELRFRLAFSAMIPTTVDDNLNTQSTKDYLEGYGSYYRTNPGEDNPFSPETSVPRIRELIRGELAGILKHVSGYNPGVYTATENERRENRKRHFLQDPDGVWRYRDDIHTALIKMVSFTNEIYDAFIAKSFSFYKDLALANFDHFGQDALEAYTFGHQVALREAQKGSFERDTKKKLWHLNYAYALDAFACHFLTDLFSSGHIRTPRFELFHTSYTGTTAGILAKAMHDEDSYYGMLVFNPHTEWTAYGDNSYFSPRSVDNRYQVRQSVQTSVDEVFAAFSEGKMSTDFAALNRIPRLTLHSTTHNQKYEDQDFIDADPPLRTHFALFREREQAGVEMRNSYEDIFEQEYVGISSLSWLKAYTFAQHFKRSKIDFRSVINQLPEEAVMPAKMNCTGSAEGLLTHSSKTVQGFYFDLSTYDFMPRDFKPTQGQKLLILAQEDYFLIRRQCKVFQLTDIGTIDLSDTSFTVSSPVDPSRIIKVEHVAFFDNHGELRKIRMPAH